LILNVGLNLYPSVVFTFRCTQKLLDRLKTAPEPEPALPDTVLGDWYAHLVRAGRSQVVLAICERTLLPVVLSAREGKTLVHRFVDSLEPVLVSVGVPVVAAIAERDAMQQWVVGRTASRRILGALNDLAYQLQVGLAHFPDRTLLEQSLWLARTPMKFIEHESPDRATAAAFAAHQAVCAARRQ
jgi:hypothetical protein